MKKSIKWAIAIIVTPLIIILSATIALYIPAVQNWAVGMASKSASEAMGMDVSVARVRLAFPLNLSVEGIKATKQDSMYPQRRDTVAYVERAVVNVQLLPLLDSRLNANDIELIGTKVNTLDIIPQARVKGNIGRLAMEGGAPVASIDLSQNRIDLKKIILDNAHLDIAMTDSVPEDTTTTENLWKIKLQELHIMNSDMLVHMAGDTIKIGAQLKELTAKEGYFDLHKGLYEIAMLQIKKSGVQYNNSISPYPTTNRLDPNHIALSDINTRIDNISVLTSDISLNIKSLSLIEQSGLIVNAMNADIKVDSTKLCFGGTLKTPSSHIATQLEMDFNAFEEQPATRKSPLTQQAGTVKANINASISKNDLAIMLSAANMNDICKILPNHPLNINGTAEGNLQSIFIPSLHANIPTVFSLDARGKANGFMALLKNPYDPRFSASLHADMHTQNVSPLVAQFTSSVSIPATKATIDLNAKGAHYTMAINANEGKGRLKADADVNIANMAYKANIDSKALNLGHFLKGMSLGTFTGKAKISGQGTDILSPRTWMIAKADVGTFNYGKYNVNNIKGNLSLKNGRAYANIDAHNKLIDGTISLDALMNSKKLDATLMTELAYIDLYNLKITDKPLKVSVCTHLDAMSDLKDTHTLQGSFGDISLTDSSKTYRPDDITLDIHTDRDTTTAKMYCGDFIFKLDAQGNYKKLMGISDKLINVMKMQFANRTIDQTELRKTLPHMSITLHSSKDNPIYRFIKYYDIDYNEIDATVNTSYEEGIKANVLLKGLATSGYQLDTISLNVNSTNEPYAIDYQGYIRNIAPNDYVFDITFDGEVLEHGISLNTIFRDADDEIGLQLGAEATMVEEGIKLHLTPERPIIGYERFKLKPDNYILLGRNNRVFADVDMVANGGTGITLYSTTTDDNTDVLQDITLSITKLDITRILSAIPYAPKASGLLDGDFHFVQEEDESFSLSSSINTKNLVYEDCPIGNLGTELVYMPKENNEHYIDGVMSIDNNEIATIKGTYNFNTSAINADMSFEKFPMRIANGFVPDRIIGLDGYAEGVLSVHGYTNKPDVNGELYLESASLISTSYGLKMRFDDDPIRIENSKLLFENFQIYANNNMPLTSYGDLDFSNLDHIKLNLLMRAENFLLIDSKETRRSEAYGKAYVNFLASIKGELDRLQVRGKLDVLPTTNLYYILHDSPLSNDNRMKELVQFTNLNANDSIKINRPQVEGMNVNFNINVMNGSHIKCWLNDARTNYLDIIGEGALQMKYKNDDIMMTGRYTISEGEIKYSLPVIPLKTFVISNGSYIEFTGDMMNPRLNITAKETKKASVNVNGNNRMVTFNTGVVLSKTLNDMGLEFIIEAPEDNAISDELNMKSKEERGKLAVTMLTTGMYLSDGNTSSFSMNSALNSFLQSEINSIAGSALKTLDLSFGMENSTGEDGNIHTDYSFKFAKRFWNNRLSISVGGKLSTGPDVSGQNKSFFDNVEVQYRLSDISNKYLNLFYNRSVYDFLEGYVGQYGGGFMWKKKVSTLKGIFKPEEQTLPVRTSTPILHNANEKKDSLKGDSAKLPK